MNSGMKEACEPSVAMTKQAHKDQRTNSVMGTETLLLFTMLL